ncbi:SLBB domain-containing protein [Photobacterium atrarenae]|uniref:SLBB domain-containing protein n=1 Tax=Photobacterium atrarenae TaxID=865757 RepID=A0ABY5GDF7_9GAMM|nr:SLBB domain-containing protein [Photobacterium atrarenae]UTV26739.1 SLBB domain-containing protein [Photobacterium atrarenae]
MKRILLALLLWIPAWLNAQILAPGDVINLQLPGEEAFSQPFIVTNSGQLLLPEVGAVSVAGMDERQAQQLLRQRLSTVYRNLDEFSLSLLSSEIRVRVLGYVNQPGTVTLAADANIQMALTAAGGLKPGAQLDKFQLTRNGVSQPLNYKAYLDSGDLRLLPALEGGDTVFVPTSPQLGNVEINFDAASLVEAGDAEQQNGLTLFGEFRNPGTFSFKDGMSVVDAVMRAGGVTRYADVTKIRVITHNQPTLFDLKAYLDSGKTEQLPPIQPGSIIFAPIEVEEISTTQRTVYIMGEVQAPGAYENSTGAGFMDVLANAGGPTRFADTTQIRVLRDNGPALLVNLVQYSHNPARAPLPDLRPGDVIFVPEKVDFNEKSWLKVTNDRAIKLIGAVYNPGRFEWDSSMSFLDVLAHAGGPNQEANLANIRILRQGSGDQNLTRFNLEAFINQGGDFSTLPTLQAGDTIIIDELPKDPTDNKASWVRQSAEDSIYVFGQVGAPGRYAFNHALGILDILAAADGPNGDANLRQLRISHRDGPTTNVSKFDLALYFETGDESLLPQVVPGDVIYVPKLDADWLDKPAHKVVRLMGEVTSPGRYTFSQEMSLLDLLAEAGGPTENAFIERIMIVNSSCCGDESQAFNLRDYVNDPGDYPLPMLRPGDTVYVPNKEDSAPSQLRQGLRDVLSMVTLIVLGAAL